MQNRDQSNSKSEDYDLVYPQIYQLQENEDNQGNNPINFPDPSVFSEQDESNENSSFTNNQMNKSFLHGFKLEEENEKRKLEQIYMVAGEEKKTHISVVELYGFFSWNLSAFVFVIYMIWAFVPNKILNEYGIYYIPNKYYAIAFPLWVAVTLFTVLQLYVAVCMFYTPDI